MLFRSGLTILTGLLLAVAAVGVAPSAWSAVSTVPPPLGDRPSPTPGDRDIWYLVLDRFGSVRSVEAYAGATPALPAWMDAHGFEVAHDARASYVKTALSLGSTLNLMQLDELAARMGPDSGDEEPFTELVRDHAVGRFLRDRGYRLIQLPSWFVPTARSAIADEVLTPSIGSDFDRLLHDTTILALWDDLDRKSTRLNSSHT